MAELDKDEESAVVNDSELLRKKTRSIPTPPQRKDIDTENEFLSALAEAGINSKLDLGLLNSFTTASQSREQLYNMIDGMCEDSTIAAILETYAEDATEYNENGDII